MADLTKEQEIEVIKSFLPEYLRSSNDIQLSSSLYDLLKDQGAYAYQFATYGTNTPYITLGIEGTFQKPDNSAAVTLAISTSNYGTDFQGNVGLDKLSFSFDETGVTGMGPRIALKTGELSGQYNPYKGTDISASVNLRALYAGLDLNYDERGMLEGFTEKVGVGAPIGSFAITAGLQVADVTINLKPAIRNLGIQAEAEAIGIYNNLEASSSFSGQITKEQFMQRFELNYERFESGSTENLSFQVGAKVIKELLGTTNDSYNINTATQSSLSQYIYQRSLEQLRLSKEANPQNITQPDERTEVFGPTKEDFIKAIKAATEPASPDGNVSESKELTLKITNTEGEEEKIKFDPAKEKVKAIHNVVVDAETGGIVILDVTSNASLGGKAYTRYERVVETSDGTRVERTTYSIKNINDRPANGVIAQETIVTKNAAGEVISTIERTRFVDATGRTHETEMTVDHTQERGYVSDTIVSDPQGQQVDAQGPTYIVPNKNLIDALHLAGGFASNLLADELADGNVYKSLVYKALLGTITEHFGTFAGYLAAGNKLDVAVDAALGREFEGAGRDIFDQPEIAQTFYEKLSGLSSGFVAGAIVNEVGDALGLEGTIGGEIFNVVAGTVTTGIAQGGIDFVIKGLDSGLYSGIFSGNFDFSAPYPPNTEGITGTYADNIQLEIFNALGAYAGARLAGEVITPESQVAAIFGSIGSVVAVKTLGSYIGSIVGSSIPGLGTAIGAFIGQVGGTLLGNLFSDAGEPMAGATVYANQSDAQYNVGRIWSENGGDLNIATSMANAAMNGVNAIISLTGGNFRRGFNEQVEIGFDHDKFFVNTSTGNQEFSNSGDAIKYAALELLKGADIVGGNAIAMRAWHNSEAKTLEQFQIDLSIADAFQTYLMNPTAILALMMNDPDSEAAQQWATILKRAAELELHLPHEKDIDGGWGEVLAARGDINPEAIPDIQGNDLVLTDPITGEVTTLKHVIGPGYEIVRTVGTDGNDTIQIIVDGPSITYTTAGPGDDTFVGHDGIDIFLGDEGDDVAYGRGGNDWLRGEDGNDKLWGELGDDLLIGGNGNDSLFGGPGMDTIYGGDGNDYIEGNGQTDWLYGGEGDDYVEGNEGENDRLFGGGGNDILRGNAGYDWLRGEEGNDTYHLNGSWMEINRLGGHDTVLIEGYGGVGNYIYFHRSIGANEVQFYKQGNDLILRIHEDNQSVTIKNAYRLSDAWLPKLMFYGQRHSAEEPIHFYTQIYNASSAVNSYTGDALYDSYIQIGNTTTPNGWLNIKAPTHGNQQTYYAANGGLDVVFGSDDNDYLEHTSNSYLGQNNYFYGGLGNDIIKLGGGSDVGIGGLGDDTIYGQNDPDVIYGGPGNDILFGDHHNDKIYGGSGNDTMSGGSDDDRLYGEEGNDNIYGDDGDDYIEGGNGSDYIISTSGKNILKGDQGDDTITGGLDNDRIYGGTGNDTINGGTGDDWLYGDEGNDTLLGGAGADTLSGGDGSDTINGEAGNDTLTGGLGADKFIIGKESGAVDTITDFEAGIDKIDLSAFSIPHTFFQNFQQTFVRDGFSTQINLGNNQSLVLRDILPEDLSLADFTGTAMKLNATPIAVNDSRTLNEDTTTTINVLGNDRDPEGDALTVVSIGSAAHGLATLNTNGTITYKPAQDYNGTDSFEYTIKDVYGNTDTASVNLTIRAVNDAPVIEKNTGASTLENGSVVLTGAMLQAKDVETAKGALLFRLTALPTHGTLYVNGVALALAAAFTQAQLTDGAITYRPVAEYHGQDSFTFAVSDGNAQSVSQSFNLSVIPEPTIMVPVDPGETTQQGGGSSAGGAGDQGASSDDNGDSGETASGTQGGGSNTGTTPTDTNGGTETPQTPATPPTPPAVNVMNGTGAAERMSGTAGADIMNGRGGSDTLLGRGDDDTLKGGGGNDMLKGNGGGDILKGQGGNDTLKGGGGHDMLYGHNGNDILIGGAGNDILNGGRGNDTLKGNAGADTFVFDRTALRGVDTIVDFKKGQGDKIDIHDLLTGYDSTDDALTDFVRITQSGRNSELFVNRDGRGEDFIKIAILQNTSGLTNEDALERQGTLITEG